MEDVVRKIIDIEEKAQKVIDSALKERVEKRAELDERLKRLKQKLIQDADIKIAQIKDMELSETRDEAEALLNKCSNRIADMESHYEQSKDEWKKMLFEAVLQTED